MSDPWFDPNTFGAWYGGIVGGVGGTLGGVLGSLAGVLAPRGKGRALVLGGMGLTFLLGLASLGFGVYAWLAGQPWGIWYAPVLAGAIFTIVMGSLFPVVRMRYAQAEQRRLEAEGLRRS